MQEGLQKEKAQSDSDAAALPSAPSQDALGPPSAPQADGGGTDVRKDDRMRWYVIHTYSGFENKVKASLEQRIREHHLEERFSDILIPTEEVVDVRDGKKITKNRRSFPGYVLVKMEMTNETWLLVKNTPKVSSFVGGKKPDAVSQKEVDAILGRAAVDQEKPVVSTTFRVGENVRVTDGVFVNFTGVVAEVNPDKSTLKIMVSILGRQAPVELDFSQVEAI
jgi:transcription termination/antitermination protein NusG